MTEGKSANWEFSHLTTRYKTSVYLEKVFSELNDGCGENIAGMILMTLLEVTVFSNHGRKHLHDITFSSCRCVS